MRQWIFGLLIVCVIPLVTACNRPVLSARSEYFDNSDLASAQVNTPDPRQDGPTYGQRVHISWSVPKEYFDGKNEPSLLLSLQYKNFETNEVVVPLEKASGHYVYTLRDEEYDNTQGILTYKVNIVSGEQVVLNEWRHQIWADRIKVDHYFDVAPSEAIVEQEDDTDDNGTENDEINPFTQNKI
jgi:hypothetical protein